jgi:hypothetical protein
VSKRANTGRLAGFIVVLVVAVVLVYSGLNHRHEPTCNKVAMKPGDLCILANGGTVSYEQRKSETDWVGLTELALGGVGILASATLLGLYLRNRRRTDAVPPTDPS